MDQDTYGKVAKLKKTQYIREPRGQPLSRRPQGCKEQTRKIIKAKHKTQQEIQEASLPAGDHKAARNSQERTRKPNTKHNKRAKRPASQQTTTTPQGTDKKTQYTREPRGQPPSRPPQGRKEQTRKHSIQESQEASLPADDNKAATNRQERTRKPNTKHKQQKGPTKPLKWKHWGIFIVKGKDCRFKITFCSALTLNAPIATKVVCFSRLLKCLRSLYGKQCGPRSDCPYRSSLFWVRTVSFFT